jgi:hypothetical protein
MASLRGLIPSCQPPTVDKSPPPGGFSLNIYCRRPRPGFHIFPAGRKYTISELVFGDFFSSGGFFPEAGRFPEKSGGGRLDFP